MDASHQEDRKKIMNSSFSSNLPGSKIDFTARKWINSLLQTAATTFASCTVLYSATTGCRTGFYGNHQCTVTILSLPPDPTVLVTAAHCTYMCLDNKNRPLPVRCIAFIFYLNYFHSSYKRIVML